MRWKLSVAKAQKEMFKAVITHEHERRHGYDTGMGKDTDMGTDTDIDMGLNIST
jgi:hypothetical protein